MPQHQSGAQTSQDDRRLHPCRHPAQVRAIRVERRLAFGHQRRGPPLPFGDLRHQSCERLACAGFPARDRLTETAESQALPVAQLPAPEVEPSFVKLSVETGEHVGWLRNR
jgi:hypothetical protein